MNIIKAGYEILRPALTKEAIDAVYRTIELAGRTCYKSEDKITETSSRKFVSNIIKHGHEAMIEHANMTVRFIVDRGVSHELVRHRLASFAQESTRYCVAGDTKLTYNNPHRHETIAELYENFKNSQNGAWKRIKIRQYNEDTGELQMAKIKNIFMNGEKECVKIKTKLGYELICTNDHSILTPSGYIQANSLNVGSEVFVNGTSELYLNYDWMYHQNITLNKTFVQIAKEFGFNVNTLKKWARKLGIPKKGTGYFNVGHTPWNKGIQCQEQIQALKKYHHCGRRKDKILKRDTVKYQKWLGIKCFICGCNDNLEVHHIDKDRRHNDPENLITVCESCHQRIHSYNLETVYADQIISIENIGILPVYDIEMNSEYHNFIANGVVVHNCSYDKEKFGNEITVIEPFWLEEGSDQYKLWYDACANAEYCYLEMLKQGATAQEARTVLPNSLKTEVVMTANMREWRNIFKLRAAGITGKPHPQMLEVMIPLLRECQKLMPELFGDIIDLETAKEIEDGVINIVKG